MDDEILRDLAEPMILIMAGATVALSTFDIVYSKFDVSTVTGFKAAFAVVILFAVGIPSIAYTLAAWVHEPDAHLAEGHP